MSWARDKTALAFLRDLSDERDKIDAVIAAVREVHGWGEIRDPNTGLFSIPPQPDYGQVSDATHDWIPGYFKRKPVFAPPTGVTKDG